MIHTNSLNFEDETAFREWLNCYDPTDQAPDELTERFISGINMLGIEVYRSSMWLPTSHPELWGTQVVWAQGRDVEIFRRDHNITSTPVYLDTPGEAVHKARKPLRWKLNVACEMLPYPLLKDVKNEGGTDYLIVPFHTDHVKEQPWITFSTKKKGGFSEPEITMLKDLCVPLSWKARVAMAEASIGSLLGVYLGQSAAQRVTNGQFKRGTGETIHAVILFCDLRCFTALGEKLSDEALVDVLDHFFECVSAPIEGFGGEILKFIGDAVLAFFPLKTASKVPCDDALDAAQQALENLRVWSAEDVEPPRPILEAGIALHVGEMLYGNIGGSSRLDFTVIGSAVNETSRVEGLCKSTFPILATKEFEQYLSRKKMVSIGDYVLRGVNDEREIFTLKEFM